MVSRCLKRPQMSREGVPPARKPFKERFRAPRARKVENIVQNALICTILVVPTGDNVGNYCSSSPRNIAWQDTWGLGNRFALRKIIGVLEPLRV